MSFRGILKNFSWDVGLFMIVYHVFLAVSLPIYFYYSTPSMGSIIAAVVLFLLTGTAITAGYHRYYAHKSYQPHLVVEAILLFFGGLSVQGPALRWSYLHRLHHNYVDTDRDPYNVNKGFWYAHFLWMLHKHEDIEPRRVKDLMNNKLVMFQYKYDKQIQLWSNLLVVGVVGLLTGDYLGAFFVSVMLRMFVVHHFTFFINSLAHYWGDQPFSKRHTAVDNFICALVTFGEGYHNYHHTHASDYRNGVRWYHFDPAKWLIWTLSKIGLAKDLHKVDFYLMRKRWVDEALDVTKDRLEKLSYVRQDFLQEKLEACAQEINTKLSQFKELKKEYGLKVEEWDKKKTALIKSRMKNLQKLINRDCNSMTKLCRGVWSLQLDIIPKASS